MHETTTPEQLKVLLGPLADLLPPLKRDVVALVSIDRDIYRITREVIALARAARIAVRYVRAAARNDVHWNP